MTYYFPGSQTVDAAQLAQMWTQIGAPANVAQAFGNGIAGAEGGNTTGAVYNTAFPSLPGYTPVLAGNQPEYSVGLYGLNIYGDLGITDPQQAFQIGQKLAQNPEYQTQVAAQMFSTRGFQPWEGDSFVHGDPSGVLSSLGYSAPPQISGGVPFSANVPSGGAAPAGGSAPVTPGAPPPTNGTVSPQPKPTLTPGTGPTQIQLGEGTEVTLPGDATWNQAAAYIKQHYPTYAWLLNDPQIRNILEQAGKQNWSSTNVQAAVAQTDWWTKTNTAMRQWEQLEHTDPASAQQKLSSMENDIVAAARSQGIKLTSRAETQELATKALQYGWDQNQVSANIGVVAGNGGSQTLSSQYLTYAQTEPGQLEFTNEQGGVLKPGQQVGQNTAADAAYHQAVEAARNANLSDMPQSLIKSLAIQSIQAGPNWDWTSELNQVAGKGEGQTKYGAGVASAMFSTPQEFEFTGAGNTYYDKARATLQQISADQGYNLTPQEILTAAQQAINSGAMDFTGGVSNQAQVQQILNRFSQVHQAPGVNPAYSSEAFSQPGMLQFTPGAQAWKGGSAADHALSTIRMALAGLPVQGVPEAQMEQLARQAMKSGALNPSTGAVSDSAQLAQILGPFAARHGAPEVSAQYLTQLINDSGQYNFAPGPNGQPDYQGATISDAALSIVRNAAMAQGLQLPQSVLESIALQGLAAGWLNPTTGQPVGDTLGNVIGSHAPQGQTLSSAYLTGAAANPGEYKFTRGGNQVTTADQMLTQVEVTAANQQVDLSLAQAQEVAMRALKGGWSSAQIQQAIGELVRATPPQPTTTPGVNLGQGMNAAGGANSVTTPAPVTAQTNAPGLLQQLRTTAAQYLMAPSASVLQQWGQNIASGTQDMQQFQAYLAQQASLKYPSMAQEIAQGITPSQITDNLQQLASTTLDISPDQVNFITNPTFQKILDGGYDEGPNGTKQANGQMMTYTQAGDYLRGLPQYQYTTGARSQGADLETAILSAFGRIGG